MNWFTRCVSWSALVALLLPTSAPAQTVPRPYDWTRGTMLNVFAGTATDSTATRALGGTALGWELTPRMAVEGSAYWLDRGTGASAFAAALKLQTGLVGPRAAVPFVDAGIGLYRASFDSAASGIPEFYGRRIAASTAAVGATSTFMDPTFVFGGGVVVHLTRHIYVRPDVEAMVVWRDSQHHAVTTAAVHVGYHFERHPIVTP